MHTLADLLNEAAARLEDASDTPRLDAELLLAHALGRGRSHLRAYPEALPSAEQARVFGQLLAARARGEPIAYLTGKREFWSLELDVTPATLIPRPETELLVEQALARIPPGVALDMLDLGTGSGAIAIAVAKERPRCRVTATDFSAEALRVAAGSAVRLGLTDLEFLQGAWFVPVAGRRFHVVVSNPPYVAEGDPHLDEGDLRFEPVTALSSGEDGLKDIRHIVAAAPAHLHAGGVLLLEHGLDQGTAVRGLLEAAGFTHTRTFQDLAGRDRVSGGDWANPAATG
ncbi:MAG TPA: peptide chain release factor N(5)-glutamine methyltransferase [Gammaproteobacteria bacterium]